MGFWKGFREGRDAALAASSKSYPPRRPKSAPNAQPPDPSVAAQLADIKKALDRIVRKLDL